MRASISVRVDADLKRRFKARLAEEGITIEAWVERRALEHLDAMSSKDADRVRGLEERVDTLESTLRHIGQEVARVVGGSR